MRHITKLTVLIVSVFLFSINLAAQESAAHLKEILEELQKNQEEMKFELQEIKSLLSKLPLSNNPSNVMQPNNIKDVEFEIGGNPVLGSGNAKLIMVEFTDYECPFCGRYVRDTFPQILKEYIDKDIVRYTVVDQPLAIHPKAEKAAQAAHCTSDQGKYWEIHKLMMAQQDSLDDLSFYAKSLDMNIAEFEDCLKTEKYKETTTKNMELSRKLGINGVPGFIIGRINSEKSGSVKVISSIRGALPFSSFQEEIEAAIAANK